MGASHTPNGRHHPYATTTANQLVNRNPNAITLRGHEGSLAKLFTSCQVLPETEAEHLMNDVNKQDQPEQKLPLSRWQRAQRLAAYVVVIGASPAILALGFLLRVLT